MHIQWYANVMTLFAYLNNHLNYWKIAYDLLMVWKYCPVNFIENDLNLVEKYSPLKMSINGIPQEKAHYWEIWDFDID